MIIDLADLYKDEDRNESTTRLQIIDTLLFECLGWSKKDCITEDHYEGEYTDYEMLLDKRKVVILEAKKEGRYFEIPETTKNREYAIQTLLAKEDTNLSKALKQVASYCYERGVQIAVICNGHQLCVFLAVRADGIPPMKGRIVVFHSLEDMANEFTLLWDLLSPDGVRAHFAQKRLMATGANLVPPRMSSSIANYPGATRRNYFQNNLQILSDIVLDSPPNSPEFEREFLEFCYCNSGALSQYTLLTKSILNSRYSSVFEGIENAPSMSPAVMKGNEISPDLLAQQMSNKPILLLGDVGVGKTSFVRNLIRVKARDYFDDAIALYIDLGSQANLTEDVKGYVLNDIKKQLSLGYDINVCKRNFVQGVYNYELQEFREGIYGYLYDLNIDKYREKEAEYLEGFVSNIGSHLERSFRHLVRGRNKQIIIFLDNADQRDDDVQQQAFLIAEEFAKRWDCTVFVALRPETYHRSQRGGALSGYHARAFTILPPRIDLVINKRVDYALMQLQGDIPLDRYDARIRGSFPGMISILKVLKYSVKRNDDLYQSIDNLAAGNVRRALDYIRMFLGSGHVNTKKIADIFDETGKYIIPSHEFLRAIIYGDSWHYSPERSPVVNIYDLLHDDAKWHFAIPVILNIVNNINMPADEDGFISVSDIVNAVQSRGFESYTVFEIISKLAESNLLDSGVKGSRGKPHRIRMTSLGMYHLNVLPKRFTYVDAVVVDTPIRGASWRSDVFDVSGIHERLKRAQKFIEYLDNQWRDSKLTENDYQWVNIKNELEKDIRSIGKRIGGKNFVES